MSTVHDAYPLAGLAGRRAQLSHRPHHLHALMNPAEHHVFKVQVLGLLQSDEELGVVGVPTAVRHGQQARACVSDVKVLIFKLSTVDGLSSGAIVVCEVTSLKTQKVTLSS